MKLVAIVSGLGALFFGWLVLSELSMAGFPDGHLTGYDRAAKIPGTILGCISIISSLYFFFLAIISRRKDISRAVFATLVGLVIVSLGVYIYLNKAI
jgi:hypothetical protein